jgi:hypothetical protein
MKTSTVKKFLERRDLLDSPNGLAFAKLQKHWRVIVWITLIIVIGFIVPAFWFTTFDWWGWVILAAYGAAVAHEIYMTWYVKHLFEKRGALSSDELFTKTA